MKDGMRVLIAYDGSAHADAALGDLRRAGLPREAEAREAEGRARPVRSRSCVEAGHFDGTSLTAARYET